jgi:polyisoprenoid-binding protein YceI
VRRRGLSAAGLALAALAGCFGFESFAPVSETWRLVPSESAIHFVGIKNNSVGVPGGFASLDGMIDGPKHSAMVEVKLGTADTGNPQRDENIRTHFFEAATFPVARFEISALPQLTEVEDVRTEVTGVLFMHGAKLPLKVPVRVSLDSHNHLHVRNAAPIVLSAHDLGMDSQLAALKAVCGHESLSGAVPVDVDLSFVHVEAD